MALTVLEDLINEVRVMSGHFPTVKAEDRMSCQYRDTTEVKVMKVRDTEFFEFSEAVDAGIDVYARIKTDTPVQIVASFLTAILDN